MCFYYIDSWLKILYLWAQSLYQLVDFLQLLGYNCLMKTCCVTGNRPQKFPWKYGKGSKHKKYLADMAQQIDDLLGDGYLHFISGGALGVDQDFAEAVLRAKRIYKPITLEIVVPCRTQAVLWSKAARLRYFSILERADKVIVLSEEYTSFCMQRRNEYMVDKSDLVLAFWNGEESGGTWQTINYAKRKHKSIKINLLT